MGHNPAYFPHNPAVFHAIPVLHDATTKRYLPAHGAADWIGCGKNESGGSMNVLANLLRKTRILALTALAAAIALGASPNARAEDGVTDNEIVVGAIGALTGPLAFVGAPGRDGLSIAFDEINKKGGINGRKIKMLF